MHSDDEVYLWIAKTRKDPASTDKTTWDDAYFEFKDAHPDLNAVYVRDMKRAVDWISTRCGPVVAATTKAAYAAALRDKAAATSGRTANLYRSMTLSIAHWLQAEGVIEAVPFEHVPRRPEAPCTRTPFLPEQIPAYAAALSMPARLLFLALAACGERVTAIANARVSDIDGDRGLLWVTKKGGARRAVPINEALRLVLDMAHNHAPPLRTAKSAHYIFLNSAGNRWTVKQFDKTCKAAFERAGLPHKIPHELRHMVGAELADANASRDIISATLGHDRTVTADHYVQTRQKEKSATLGMATWDGALLGHIMTAFEQKTPERETD